MTDPSHAPTPYATRFTSLGLAIGGFAQLAQIILFREIMAVCHGTEFLFGVVLAAWLAGTALGVALAARAAAGRRQEDAMGMRPRLPETDALNPVEHTSRSVHSDLRAPLTATMAPDSAEHTSRSVLLDLRRLLAATMALNGLLLVAEILATRTLAGWGSVSAGQVVSVTHASLIAILACVPMAAAGGFQFAVALRMLPAGGFGVLYRAESWGAVVTGLAFTFLLVSLTASLRIALIAGALFAAIALFALRPLPRLSSFVLTGSAAVSLALAFLPLERAAEEMRWRRLLPGYQLLEFRDTPYGRVCALQRPQSRQVSIYHSGTLVTSLEADAVPTETRQLADLCAALHPSPRRTLLVGGSLGALPTEMLRHDLQRVDAVELDPALFDLAARHGSPATHPDRIHRIAADARTFIRRAAPASYDLVIVSAGEPDTATVNRFYTEEFFEEASRCLTDAGILIVFLPTFGASVEYIGETLAQRTASVLLAMERVFPTVRAAPVWGHMLVASKQREPLTFAPAALARRIAGRPRAQPTIPVESDGVVKQQPVPAEDYFTALLGGMLATQRALDGTERQELVEALEQSLRAAENNVRVNRDMHPVAVAESLAVGWEVAGAIFAHLLQRWSVWTIVVPLAAVAIVGLVAAWRRSGRAAGWLGAFAIGVFGMATEVGLLAAYQNVRGCVYGEIGGLLASFMAGLAIGSGVADRFIRTKPRLIITLAAMMLFAVLLTPAIVAASQFAVGGLAAACLWLLVVLSGVLDGAALSSLAVCGTGGGTQSIYGFDLFGACVGALLCGSLWIPLVGLAGAMLTVAAVVAASALALTLTPKIK